MYKRKYLFKFKNEAEFNAVKASRSPEEVYISHLGKMYSLLLANKKNPIIYCCCRKALVDSRWAAWYRKKESEAQPEDFQKKHAKPGWPVKYYIKTRRPPSILENTQFSLAVGTN